MEGGHKALATPDKKPGAASVCPTAPAVYVDVAAGEPCHGTNQRWYFGRVVLRTDYRVAEAPERQPVNQTAYLPTSGRKYLGGAASGRVTSTVNGPKTLLASPSSPGRLVSVSTTEPKGWLPAGSKVESTMT